jgi:hypothetical protein
MRGWHVMLFGQDEGGFDNLLPRFSSEFGYADKAPSVGDSNFVFPQTSGSLRIFDDAKGKHSIIVVFHRDGFPSNLVERILSAAGPKQLTATLDVLASWLGGRSPSTFKVMRQDYEVRAR